MNTLINEEILDLVDDDDNVVDAMPRREVYLRNYDNFRVIDAFIKNSKGQLFIPRRTAKKRLFPSCLDSSVGGHVDSGESYEEAFIREAAEELNIDVSKFSYRCLGKVTPVISNVWSFITVFEIESDEVPQYNPLDIADYYWLTPEELLSRIEDGDKTKPNLPKIVKYFYTS